MDLTFLAPAAEFTGGDIAGLGAIMAALMAFLAVFLVIGVLMYIFISFAFMSIAKKANYSNPGIAWIPVVGPGIITSQVAKMHWWPLLLLIGNFIPIIGFFSGLAFSIFSIIWLYKTYEVIGKPGWWAILLIIPPVGLILLAIAAWSK